MTVNPCSINDPYGTNYTVPVQQFNVATLPTSSTETLYFLENDFVQVRMESKVMFFKREYRSEALCQFYPQYRKKQRHFFDDIFQ